ncbi:MAG: 30S ribosomal protein S17 [Patescibacteria group bacterium]|nr:30S ribosomal protein S17 [bacterium]MDZ4221674.1 30S ribosomal protein S17 [Patescibacteria group bacterium]
MEEKAQKTAVNKRTFAGTVVKTAMRNTVVVRVDRVKIHPRYHKRYTVSKRYACDYRGSGISVGDKVTIQETRPISKTKRWRVLGTEAPKG